MTTPPDEAVARTLLDRCVPRDGSESGFSVALHTRDGRLIRERHFRDAPREMAPAVRDSLERELDRHLEDAPPHVRTAVEEHLDLPAFLPPVSAVAEAPDGSLWVAREDMAGSQVEFLILDSGWEPTARVRLPPSARRIAAFADDHVWVRETIDWDVPVLVRYKIQR